MPAAPPHTPQRQLDLERWATASIGCTGRRRAFANHAAEDLVRETYARALRKPRFVRSEDDIGYLLRVLRNAFFSSRRAEARRPQTASMPDDMVLACGRPRDRDAADVDEHGDADDGEDVPVGLQVVAATGQLADALDDD